MINKELLSKILSVDIEEIGTDIPNSPDLPAPNYVQYTIKGLYGEYYHINKYEVMHLAKLWVCKDTRCYISTACFNTSHVRVSVGVKGDPDNSQLTFDGECEYEMVIQACEWVLQRTK